MRDGPAQGAAGLRAGDAIQIERFVEDGVRVTHRIVVQRPLQGEDGRCHSTAVIPVHAGIQIAVFLDSRFGGSDGLGAGLAEHRIDDPADLAAEIVAGCVVARILRTPAVLESPGDTLVQDLVAQVAVVVVGVRQHGPLDLALGQ